MSTTGDLLRAIAPARDEQNATEWIGSIHNKHQPDRKNLAQAAHGSSPS